MEEHNNITEERNNSLYELIGESGVDKWKLKDGNCKTD